MLNYAVNIADQRIVLIVLISVSAAKDKKKAQQIKKISELLIKLSYIRSKKRKRKEVR